MKYQYLYSLTNFRQKKHLVALTVLFICFLQFVIYGQPEFNQKEVSSIKNKKTVSRSFKYHLPQDKFPLPEIPKQTDAPTIDGGVDSTFGASVSESFGYINKSIVQPDGKILVVGLFQRTNGLRTNCIARFNADGTSDTTFNTNGGSNAAIRAMVLQSDGKIIIGGAFTSFGGQNVNRIIRLNSNGTIDNSFSLSTVLGGQVNDILILPNGKIMMGGSFSISSSSLVRLNSDGTLDTGVDIIFGTVNSIALAPDGKIVVGGEFTSPRPNVARLNSIGTIDTSFVLTSGGAGYPVNDVIVQPDGKIIAGGVFSSFNGVQTDGAVRLTNTGAVDITFDITNDPTVFDFEVGAVALQDDGKILINYFSNSSTIIADIRRYNSDASPDTTFNTNTNNSLYGTHINILPDGNILASGFFTSINNQTRLRIAKFGNTGNLDNSFVPQVSTSGIVYAITRQPDGKVLIGGDFDNVNGVRKNAIARLNADGTLDTTFTIGAGFFGDIYSIAVQPDGKIIIGGLLSGDANLFPAYAAARLNSNGSFDTSLNAAAFVIYDIFQQNDGKIILSGQINQNNAAARLNSDGTPDNSFTPPKITNGTARTILVQPSGKIIIGGTFFPTGGLNPRNGILRLNSDGTLDSAFSTPVGNVYKLAAKSDGSIYAAGFTINRFSSEGVVDPTFNVGSGFNGFIRAMALQSDNKIVLGGFFTVYNGNSVNRVIRIRENATIDLTTFDVGSGPAGNIFALNLENSGKIIVGGQFLDFANSEKLSIVRLQNSVLRQTPFDFDGDSKTDISIFRPSLGQWWYLRSSDNANRAFSFGSSTDKIVPADYTGDGKTDIATFNPSTGFWSIMRSEDSAFFGFPFGTNGDIAAPADYDGDGKADAAVFRTSNSTWYISKSSGGTTIQQFGASGDRPTVADYDGDGKADLAIYRVALGQWWYLRSSDGTNRAFQFGTSTDKPMQGDYTGDGKADLAFFRPTTGEWFVLRSEDSTFYGFPFGASGDIPASGDYDGDGRFDAAVFRPTNTTWYLNRSTSGVGIVGFGANGDIPVPNAFVP